MNTISDKKILRKAFIALRASRPQHVRAEMSNQMTAQFLNSEFYHRAQTIFSYYPTNEEIDTRQILAAAWRDGKHVCVPRCEAERGIMTARLIYSSNDLFPQKYGLLEPTASAPIVNPLEINLCLVPCLAATFDGIRLGYGGGYYDRFLQQTKQAIAIALCAEETLLRQLPQDIYDFPCDYILTERRILPCEK